MHRKLKSLGIVTTSKSGARIAQMEDEDTEPDIED